MGAVGSGMILLARVAMLSLFVYCLTVLVLVAASQLPAADGRSAAETHDQTAVQVPGSKETPEQLLAHVSAEYEPAQQVTRYSPRISTSAGPGIIVYPYVARHDDGKRWLRLRAILRREDWVFVEKMHFLIDGASIDIPLDNLKDIHRDVSGGGVTETVDVGKQDLVIRRIATGKEVHVSFMGRTRRENYQLTQDDIENFQQIIALYDWPGLPSVKGKPEGKLQESLAPEPPESVPSEPTIKGSSNDNEPTYAGLDGVTNPRLIRTTSVAPKYPEVARRRKVEGRVILQCVVRKDGSVGDFKVLQAPGQGLGFEEAAISAVRLWKYEPGLKDGKPVDVYFTIVVDFTLSR